MAVKPRWEPRPATRVITREEYDAGFDVHCNGKYMRVGYQKIGQYSDGRVVVRDPVWREF